MAVLVEGISVVVRRRAVDATYPGGWAQFVRDAPNRTLCADADLARVGFMVPDDVQAFVAGLERHGLKFKVDGHAVDVAVVDQINGPTVRCDWLECGQVKMTAGTVSACRVAGSRDESLICPEGWKYEGSLSQKFAFVPTGRTDAALEFLRHENGLDVFRDRETGKEVYIGRTSPAQGLRPK